MQSQAGPQFRSPNKEKSFRRQTRNDLWPNRQKMISLYLFWVVNFFYTLLIIFGELKNKQPNLLEKLHFSFNQWLCEKFIVLKFNFNLPTSDRNRILFWQNSRRNKMEYFPGLCYQSRLFDVWFVTFSNRKISLKFFAHFQQ